MIVPIGISTYPYFTEWQLPAVMSAKTTTTKNRVKSHKEHSAKYTPPTPYPTSKKADNVAQRDYDTPIPSR